jgi:hypothetical protein
MPDRPEASVERFSFDCARCGKAWTTTYEILDLVGPEGDEVELHYVDGAPSASPRVGRPCPACGNNPVKGYPAATAAGRPRAGRDAHRHMHQVAGTPLVVQLGERQHGQGPGGRTTVRVSLGSTKLELVFGPGALPADARATLQGPEPAVVAGLDGLYATGHWSEPRGRLAWEVGGRWFLLSGLAGREVLTKVARALVQDPPELIERGRPGHIA